MTTLKYPVKPADGIDDQTIVDQLPVNVIRELGELEETGFHLTLRRRDIFYKKGLVQYVLGANTAIVKIDDTNTSKEAA